MTELATHFWPSRKVESTRLNLPDPGAWRQAVAAGQEAFYHNPATALYRWVELSNLLANGVENEEKISAAEAAERFGLEGELEFDAPIYPSAARLMYERKQRELARNYTLAAGPQHLGRTALKFGASLAASVVDPLNIAISFIPGLRETRWLRLLGTKGGQNTVARRALAGAATGAIGAAALEPLTYLASAQDQSEHTIGDSLINVAAGGILGGAFSVGGGALLDLKTKAEMAKDVANILNDAASSAGERFKKTSPETQETAFMSAVTDMIQEEPVSSPAKVLSLDPRVIREAANDNARLRRLSQEGPEGRQDVVQVSDTLTDNGRPLPDPKTVLVWHTLEQPNAAAAADGPRILYQDIEGLSRSVPEDTSFRENQVRLENPIDLTTLRRDFKKIVSEAGLDQDLGRARAVGGKSIVIEAETGATLALVPEIREALVRRGHDGIIGQSRWERTISGERASAEIAVFEPKQVTPLSRATRAGDLQRELKSIGDQILNDRVRAEAAARQDEANHARLKKEAALNEDTPLPPEEDYANTRKSRETTEPRQEGDRATERGEEEGGPQGEDREAVLASLGDLTTHERAAAAEVLADYLPDNLIARYVRAAADCLL